MIDKAKSIADIKAVPFFSQFTDEQIIVQLKKNIETLEVMKAKADKTGKKVGGNTSEQLAELIQNYKNIIAKG
jgi:DNA uptake protein ComE-like DNA-binding protein